MLSTKELMTVPIRPLVDRTYLEQVLLSRFSHGEVQQWVQKYFQPYRELMSYYRCAIMEVETKFNVLNEELSLQYDRNPIETIKTRLKSPESIMAKLNTKMGIGMKTLTDRSTRNLAEMLSEGSSQGVMDCIKSQKDYPDAAPGSKRLMQKLQDLEEENRLKLEQFL